MKLDGCQHELEGFQRFLTLMIKHALQMKAGEKQSVPALHRMGNHLEVPDNQLGMNDSAEAVEVEASPIPGSQIPPTLEVPETAEPVQEIMLEEAMRVPMEVEPCEPAVPAEEGPENVEQMATPAGPNNAVPDVPPTSEEKPLRDAGVEKALQACAVPNVAAEEAVGNDVVEKVAANPEAGPKNGTSEENVDEKEALKVQELQEMASPPDQQLAVPKPLRNADIFPEDPPAGAGHVVNQDEALQAQMAALQAKMLEMANKLDKASKSTADEAAAVKGAAPIPGPDGSMDREDDQPEDPEMIALIIATSANTSSKADGKVNEAKAKEAASEKISTLTHKPAYMRLQRFMQGSEGKKFPHMKKMFEGDASVPWTDKLMMLKKINVYNCIFVWSKERKALLRSWVLNEENRNSVEAEVVLQRNKGQRFQGVRECISVREMMLRKWPRNKILGAISAGGGIKDEHCPDDPTLTSYWVVTGRSLTDHEEANQSCNMRMNMEVNAESADMMLQAVPLGGNVGSQLAVATAEQLDLLQASMSALVLKVFWDCWEVLCVEFVCLFVFVLWSRAVLS